MSPQLGRSNPRPPSRLSDGPRHQTRRKGEARWGSFENAPTESHRLNYLTTEPHRGNKNVLGVCSLGCRRFLGKFIVVQNLHTELHQRSG